MPSKVRFLPSAQQDLEESSLWYETQGSGLGLQFVAAVEDCLAIIQDHPHAFTEVIPGVRRILTKRFPYAIYYLPESGRIVILAILHCSRSPKIWKRRARSRR